MVVRLLSTVLGTLLGRVLMAWMAAAVLVVLLMAWWMPLGSNQSVGIGLMCFYVALPAGLLVWCLWATVRRPKLAWPAPVLLVVFCAAFVASAEPLVTAGALVGLLANRGAYDAIVRDAKSGRLASTEGQTARRGRTRYAYGGLGTTGGVLFPWDHGLGGGYIGIVYDERDCPPVPLPKSSPPPASSPPAGGEEALPTIKNPGRLDYRVHLLGHYCLSQFVGM